MSQVREVMQIGTARALSNEGYGGEGALVNVAYNHCNPSLVLKDARWVAPTYPSGSPVEVGHSRMRLTRTGL